MENCGLLANVEINFADLDVNEAGMRLSSRFASRSEAGDRRRSRATIRRGKTCKAGTDSLLRRVRLRAWQPWWLSQVPWVLPHSAACAAHDRVDETVVVGIVEDAGVGSRCFLCCVCQVRRCLRVTQLMSSRPCCMDKQTGRRLCDHERMATTVLRSCREDLGRAVPRRETW